MAPTRTLLSPLLLALLACGEAVPLEEEQQNPEPTVSVTPRSLVPAPWKVRYADGSNNVTLAWRDEGEGRGSWRYTPVTPQRSSSGVYSGGLPAGGRLTPMQEQALWKRLETLEADPSLHAESRAMGTAAVNLSTPDGSRSFVLAPGPALDELDAWLAAVRTP